MISDMRYQQVERKVVWSMAEQGTSLRIVDPNCAKGPGRTVAPWALSVGMLMVIAGCSTAPAPLQPVDSATRSTLPGVMSDPKPIIASPLEGASAVPSEASDRDKFSDPFAKSEESAGDEHDPWEPFNSTMFEFNRKVDRFVLKPVAQGYNFVVPDVAQVGVSNFFHNVRFVPRLLNNVFQAKAKGAGIEMGRFLINSTVGIAGFFDPATHWLHLDTPDEDSGQTLGFYGVPPGPYLVLPLFPPLTLRDSIGYVADLALDPINWLVFPTIEADGVPSAVAHSNRTTSTIAQFGTRVGQTVNDRSLNLETFEGVEESTIDLYAAVRNAYLQKRAKTVRE